MKTDDKSTAYVVTDGEYSDFHVIGVCSTLERAEEMRSLYAASNDIREYLIDFMPEHPPGMLAFKVLMTISGDIERSWQTSIEEMDPANFQVAVSPYTIAGGKFLLILRIWAPDKEHAIKIAGDTRTRLLAQDEWY